MESSIETSQTGGASNPKPALGPKPRLTPKPFSLQKNTTIRSINAPKRVNTTFKSTTNQTGKSEATGVPRPSLTTQDQKPLQQTTTSDSKPTSVSVHTNDKPKTTKESKTSPHEEDTLDSSVAPGKSDPASQTAPPKPKPVQKHDVIQTNHKASTDLVTNSEQIEEKKTEHETQTSINKKPEESRSDGSSAANPTYRWGSTRRGLPSELTSKFESGGPSVPPQPSIAATTSNSKDDSNKLVSSDRQTTELPNSESDEGQMKEDYSGGRSIKRRISLLFDSSLRPEITTKKEEPEIMNSTGGVKERIKHWTAETSSEALKTDKKPQVVPRPRTRSIEPVTAPTAEKTTKTALIELPAVAPSVSPSSKDVPTEEKPLNTSKETQGEDKDNKSTEGEVQRRSHSPSTTQTASDEGDSAPGEGAQSALKRNNGKRRSVHFGIVERDDGGPPLILGSASESSSEEEEEEEGEETPEDKAEKDTSVSIPVYRRAGILQQRDDEIRKKEEEQLKDAEFEERRRAEENEKARLKLEEKHKQEEEEKREKEKARQREEQRLREEERERQRLMEEEMERQQKEKWEKQRLKEEEMHRQRLREEEMERERQVEVMWQRQREEDRERAKQKEERLKQDLREKEERERERQVEVMWKRQREEDRERAKQKEERLNQDLREKEEERLREEKMKEERLREERERQRLREEERLIHEQHRFEGKLREEEMTKEKQREEEWEKEWVKQTDSLGGEEERGRENELWHRKKEEEEERARQKEERLKQEEREEERLREEAAKIERERKRRLEEKERMKLQMEKEAEMERIRQKEKQREEERREEERKRQVEKEREEELERKMLKELERKRAQELEEKLRMDEERERKELDLVLRKRESAVDKAESSLISFDSEVVPQRSETPRSPFTKMCEIEDGQIEVAYDDFSVGKKSLIDVDFDDFSVKPKRWGSQAKAESSVKAETSAVVQSWSTSPVDNKEAEVLVPLNVWSQENIDPHSPEPPPAVDSPEEEEKEGSEEEEEERPEKGQLISMEVEEEEERREREEEVHEAEEKDKEETQINSYIINREDEDTDALIDSEPDQQNGDHEQTSETDSPEHIPDQVPEVSSHDVDIPDFHTEPELAPFPESSTPLLDTSAQRSKANVGKRRIRTRPSRLLRAGLTQGEIMDWRACDSTDGKEESSTQRDSDSEEEQPKPKIVCSPPTSQRVPMFPGLSPAALIAQLKRRTGGGGAEGEEAEEDKGREERASQHEEIARSPSQLSQSPRSAAHLAGAARVLPPLGGTDEGTNSSPAWLKELKSKKRLSQHGSEA